MRNYNPTPANPLDLEQLRRYVQNELERIATTFELYLDGQTSLNLFSFAGYGGMYMSVPTAGNDITAAWDKLTHFDTLSVNPSRLITFDTATDTFQFDQPGVYQANINLVVEHDEVNNGRTFSIRFWNATDGVSAGSIIAATGRNQGATSLSASIIVEVPETGVGDFWEIDIGLATGTPTGTYTTVIYDTLRLDIASAGEWRGTLQSAENAAVMAIRGA